MMFKTTPRPYFLSISPSSSSDDDEASISMVEKTLRQNEAYQSSSLSMLSLIESRIHLNNLKLDLYDYIKKQKKGSYKRRFWIDQVSFYAFDDEADKIPEALRVLKLIRSQQKKKNISHFLSKIMQELDENNEDLDDEDFENAENLLIKPRKQNKLEPNLMNFISLLPKRDPQEISWIALAKKVNADILRSRDPTKSVDSGFNKSIESNNSIMPWRDPSSNIGAIFNNTIGKAKHRDPIKFVDVGFNKTIDNEFNKPNNGGFNNSESSLNFSNDPLELYQLDLSQFFQSKSSAPTLITGLQLYKAYIMFHKLLPIQAKWSREDDEMLAKAVTRHGVEDWKQIANYLDGRDTGACFQRWFKYVNPSITKGKWTTLEDIKLALYLEYFGKGKWSIIAKKFNNRTDVQIRERWCNILDPRLQNGNKWRPEEDQLLLKQAPKQNFRWSVIAGFFQGRTDNQCTRRYKKLISGKNKGQFEKIELFPKRKSIKFEGEHSFSVSEAIAKGLPIFKIIRPEIVKNEEAE